MLLNQKIKESLGDIFKNITDEQFHAKGLKTLQVISEGSLPTAVLLKRTDDTSEKFVITEADIETLPVQKIYTVTHNDGLTWYSCYTVADAVDYIREKIGV